MISALSHGRSRIRTAYICSSCLLHSRLPLSHSHSPPHTLNTIANHTWRARAASFSTSRATCNDQSETTSIGGTADDGLAISAGQNAQTGSTAAPKGKSKGKGNAIDTPSTEIEKRKPAKPTKESARGKKGQPDVKPNTWESKIDDLRATFLTEAAGESATTKALPERKASSKLEDLKSVFLAEIAQAAIESKVTPSTTKPQAGKKASNTTTKSKTQKPTDLTAFPQSAKESKTPPENSWSLRTEQLRESFLKEEKQSTIETEQVPKDADQKVISPAWLLKINKLKSSFLTATAIPAVSRESSPLKIQDQASLESTPNPSTVGALVVRKQLTDNGVVSKRPTRMQRILATRDSKINVGLLQKKSTDIQEENPPNKELQAEGASVARRPVSNVVDDMQTPEIAPVRKLSQRGRKRAKRAAMKRKSTGSQENPPDKQLHEALQSAFETSFDSNVTAAIKDIQSGSSSTKGLPAKLRLTNQKKGLSIKEAMRLPTKRRSRISLPPTKKSSKDKNDRTPTQEIKVAKGMVGSVEKITPKGLELVPINVPQPPVPSLSYGLDRVLFNPGVYQLQDPRSRVFNFDPYLQTIMPVKEFDFSLLKKFITSSRDETLLQVTKTEEKKYTGSTSSMTAALSHFHYLISNWRPIDVGVLSKQFPAPFETFTAFQRSPAALYLRWRDGVYAIDADKQYDTSNILSMLGQSMEKLLTHSTKEFERYRKNSPDPVSEETRKESEAYHYTTMGDFLMRSQLDAHDPRVPGTGMFDLKTRAVISIRMDTSAYEEGNSYEIRSRHGEWESFEREYYDMIRSAFLKYSLQVRIGRMDGIFVAFHNTERIFGFQYISLPEMDAALHGTEDTTLGDSEFKLSLNLLNRVLDRATAKWPNQSLRLLCETRPHAAEHSNPYMYIFAEPMDEKKIEALQSTNKAKIEAFEKDVLGLGKETGEDTILEESIGTEGRGSESAEEIDEVKEAQVVDQVDEVEDIQPSPSPAWDFDAEESDKLAESAHNEESSKDIEGTTWDFDENIADQAKQEVKTDPEKAPNDGEESEQTIMAMYLTTRNKVNGEPVQRPTSLKPEDEWELEYSLAEIAGPTKARSLYDACKQRRNMVYNRDKEADDGNQWANSFREEIKRYTMKGREYRAKLNAEQSNEPHKVVYESGFGKDGGKEGGKEASTGDDG